MANSKHNLVKRGLAEVVDGKLVLSPQGQRLFAKKRQSGTLSPLQIIMLREIQDGLQTGRIHTTGKNELVRKIIPQIPRKKIIRIRPK